MKKTIRTIALGLGLTGLVLLAGGGYLLVEQQRFDASAIRTTGTVIEVLRSRESLSSGSSSAHRIEYLYRPRVRFTDDNGAEREFLSSVATRSLQHQPGQQITVWYDPNDPATARIDRTSDAVAGLMLLGMGAVFLLFGGGFGLYLLRERARRRLRQTGTLVHAEIVEVEKNPSLQVNGRTPWRIRAQWKNPTTGKTHLFVSENLWLDPGPFLDNRTVKVYIERNNPKRHYMDVSFLPETA
ncbi:MAG TPA: DUF3592 domain-containing protein [Chromatiales bacterium]|nr:DUF3592 domain-containing protein [Chromatiales bacterium]